MLKEIWDGIRAITIGLFIGTFLCFGLLVILQLFVWGIEWCRGV